MHLIAAPDPRLFEMSPKCGDIDGGFECVVESAEYMAKLKGLEMRDIKIRINEEHIDAIVNDSDKIEFIMPALQEAGTYSVHLAMDGKQFIETNVTFTAFKVQCIECKPIEINLSEFAESDERKTVELEAKIKGFAAAENAENYRMQLIGDTELVQTEEHSAEDGSIC